MGNEPFEVQDIAQRVRDKMPGSEPKDPSSPLRGLGKAGAAIAENMAAGIPAGARALIRAAQRDLAAPLAAALPFRLGRFYMSGALAVPSLAAIGGGSAGPTTRQGDTVTNEFHVTAPAGHAPDVNMFLEQIELKLRQQGYSYPGS